MNRGLGQRAIALILIASSVAFMIIVLQGKNMQDLLKTLLISIQYSQQGIIAYILLYNLATVLLIPAVILTLGGGAIYGVFWGSIYVFIASTLGATLAFLLGRYVSRDWAIRKLSQYPKFLALDRAVVKSGFKIVLLTRLSPIFPFNLLNYTFGVMQVSLQDYVLGSIGMIPGIVGYTYIGSLIGDITQLGNSSLDLGIRGQIVQGTIYAIGTLATLSLIMYGSKLAQKTLEESL